MARENFHITIHAGEGFGLPSIWEARSVRGRPPGSRRAHHRRHPPAPGGGGRAGRLASYVRDADPAGDAPDLDAETGEAESIKDDPIGRLRELLFRVTVNTDNG